MDKHQIRLIFFIILVVAIWWLAPTLIFRCWGYPNGPGTYGDTFGSINALFSALAFALLIYTSLMQKEELELQRLELQRANDIHKEQTRFLQQQLFIAMRSNLKDLKPSLVLEESSWEGSLCSCLFRLTGSPSFIEIDQSLSKADLLSDIDEFAHNPEELISITINGQGSNFKVTFVLTNMLGSKFTQELSLMDKNLTITDPVDLGANYR
jgi:uncharacterized membrane protein